VLWSEIGKPRPHSVARVAAFGDKESSSMTNALFRARLQSAELMAGHGSREILTPLLAALERVATAGKFVPVRLNASLNVWRLIRKLKVDRKQSVVVNLGRPSFVAAHLWKMGE
jgi:hypothetical protein